MHYQISRNGQMYGPYTIEDLQRYLASGNVLPSDMAKSESMTEWMPVSEILAGAAAAPAHTGTPPDAASASPGPVYTGPEFGGQSYNPAAQRAGAMAVSPYPDAPNLHWGLVLLFGLLTCTLFMFIWNLVVAAWLRRVQPNATSLFYYTGALVLALVQVMVSASVSMHHVMGPGLHMYSDNPVGSLIGLAVWVVRLIARFSQRASLEEHFNGPEPVGLRLSGVMTFFFGGIYFQYHLNQINAMKQAARYQAVVPRY